MGTKITYTHLKIKWGNAQLQVLNSEYSKSLGFTWLINSGASLKTGNKPNEDL